MPEITPAALAEVRDRDSLFIFLGDKLNWAVDETPDTFLYKGPELPGETAALVNVGRIVPFTGGDPFIIFLAEFKAGFRRSTLRDVLRGVRADARLNAMYQGKSTGDFIFVCPTEKYSGVRFARFEEREGKQPRLSVFGWDADSIQETHTLCSISLPSLWLTSDLYGHPDWDDSKQRWADAWDVEGVTRAFYDEYEIVFREAERAIPDLTGEDRRLFTQTLFNRLMFIRFLEKKGWMEFAGKRDYLSRLWQDYELRRSPDDTFHETRLKALFFAALNNPQRVNLSAINGGQGTADHIGRVPFLNGGLFERAKLDDISVHVPDSVIQAVLDRLFRRFNFTVTEATPLDVDVAVDPEMLGKVFERLVTGRHETGSYYTPRNVVSFMCKEALVGYLLSVLRDEDRQRIEAFVNEGDATNLARPEAVLHALEEVSVCDPACGSGAYLLGMMQELLHLRAALFTARQLDAKTLYDRKLEIIERNLYGVDKDKFAVNVAMLRLWLSLVVDDTRNPLVEPGIDVSLPNLKFKIQEGDSLVAPDPTEITLQRESYAAEASKLSQLHHEYFKPKRPGTGRPKDEVEKDLEAVQAEIAGLFGTEASEGVLDWRVAFAEVFAPRMPTATIDGRFAFVNDVQAQQVFVEAASGGGGFDVVLANPPYVRADAQFKHIKNEKERQEEIKAWKAERALLGKTGVYSTLYEKWDLYIPFLERAYQLLRPGGRMLYIVADSYNAAKYSTRSHEFFLQQTRVERIDFCSEIDLFDAGVNNTIVHFAKCEPAPDDCPVRVRRWGESREDFDANQEPLPAAPQTETGRSLFRADGAYQEERDGTVRLNSICYASYGLRANSDDRFWKGEFVTEDLVCDAPDSAHPKPFFEGKDLVRWHVRRVRYLEWDTDRAPRKLARPTFPELHAVSEKLVALVVASSRPPVALDTRGCVTTHTSCIFVPWHALYNVRNRSIRKTAKYRDEFKPDEAKPNLCREDLEALSREFSLKYLLAVMNSSFARDSLSKRRRSKMHIYPDDWKDLPIMPIPLGGQQEFVQLVDAILAEFAKHGHPLPPDSRQRVTAIEREIDERVAALYGL